MVGAAPQVVEIWEQERGLGDKWSDQLGEIGAARAEDTTSTPTVLFCHSGEGGQLWT